MCTLGMMKAVGDSAMAAWRQGLGLVHPCVTKTLELVETDPLNWLLRKDGLTILYGSYAHAIIFYKVNDKLEAMIEHDRYEFTALTDKERELIVEATLKILTRKLIAGLGHWEKEPADPKQREWMIKTYGKPSMLAGGTGD